MKSVGASKRLEFGRREWTFLGAFSLVNWMQGVIYSLQLQGLLVYPQTFTNPNGTAVTDGTDGTPPEDISATFFGFIMSFYKITGFILTPIFGYYMEQIGLKRVYMFGVYVGTASPLLFALLGFLRPYYTLFILCSFVIRGLAAAGAVGIQTSLYMMINVIYPGRIVTVFALMQAMATLGTSLGPVMAWIIFTFAGFSISFGTTALIQVGVAFLIFKVLPELAERESLAVTLKELMVAFVKFMSIIEVLLFLFATLTVSLGTEFISVTIQQFIAQFNLTSFEVGSLLFLTCALQLVAPGWGLLMDFKWNGEILVLIGSIIAIIAVILIGPISFVSSSPSVAFVAIGLTLFGLGQGAITVSAYSKLIDEARYGGFEDNMLTITLTSTVFVGTAALGGFLGPVIGAVLYDDYGFRRGSIFLFVLYIVLACAILVFMYLTRNRVVEVDEDATEGSPEQTDTNERFENEATPLLSTPKNFTA